MTKRNLEKGSPKCADTADSTANGAKTQVEDTSAAHSRQLPTMPTTDALEPWEPWVDDEQVSIGTLLLRTLVDCNTDVVGGALESLEGGLRGPR